MGADDAPSPVGPDSSPTENEPAWLEWVRRVTRLDLRPGRPPSNLRWAVATVASVAASLGLCALAVHVATSEYPSTAHFSHFEFSDYATLTVIGVLAAAAGWAALVRLSSVPRWVYLRLAVLVTLVLWLPDVWLFVKGESSQGVVTLAVMHLLIAVVTYNLVVRVAPVGPRLSPSSETTGLDPGATPVPLRLSDRAVRRIWSSLGLLVVLELGLGVAVIVSVPFRRPAAILPPRGTWVYAAHGAVGIALGVGALALLLLAPLAGRMGRIGAVMGAIGVGIGLVGGVLSTFQQTRLLGMGVMLLGVVVSVVGYLAPSLEALGKAEAERAEAARAALAGSRAAGQGLTGYAGGTSADVGVSSNGHAASNGQSAAPPSR